MTANDAPTPDLDRFARMIFDALDWPNGWGVSGGVVQDIAVTCGLLTPETRYARCGEVCQCADYYADPYDWSDGITCYRKHPVLLEEAP